MPASSDHSQSAKGLVEIWDDQAILHAALDKSRALLESLLAQRRDLEMRGGAAPADNHLALSGAMDSAIEAVRRTMGATDVQMPSENSER